MDCVLYIQLFSQRREIVGVSIHFIAVPRLVGAPMPPSVMRDHAIAPLAEEEHLPVPVVRGKRPTMGENDRLTRSPILVINLRAILRCDRCHTSSWLLHRCECKSLFGTELIAITLRKTIILVCLPYICKRASRRRCHSKLAATAMRPAHMFQDR